jgi:magnesium transporter
VLDPSRIHLPVTQATVDCGVYLDGGRLPGRYTHAAAHAKVSELASETGAAFVWIGLHEPDEHQMRSVAEVFGLHPLLVRGAIQTPYRPRLERYDDTLVLVLKTAYYANHDGLRDVRHFVKTGEVMITVGPGLVITVRHGQHRGLAEVREQIHQSPTIPKPGPYAVMSAIAEHVVDGYQRVSDLLETDIDAIQSVSPSTSAMGSVDTDHGDLVSAEVRRYMRAVLERHLQAAERIVSYDVMVSTLIDAALGKIAASSCSATSVAGDGSSRPA